jgi:hypothetical protein
MHKANRFRLRGIYQTPFYWIGQVITDEIRGEVVITGVSSGPLPWPLARREGGGRASLAVYGGLADALFRESAQAVTHWWGVAPSTVSLWRKRLGIARRRRNA